MRKQKWPSPLCERGAAEKLDTQRSYPRHADGQDLALRAVGIVAEILDIEARLLSALFTDPAGGYVRAIDAGLCDAGQFIDRAHADLFVVLMHMGSGAVGTTPADEETRLDLVRRVMRRAFGHDFQRLDGRDALGPLLLCECSSAGVERYSQLLVHADRKRRQIRRLHRVLVALATDGRLWGLGAAA